MNKSPYTELKNLKCWNIIENAIINQSLHHHEAMHPK